MRLAHYISPMFKKAGFGLAVVVLLMVPLAVSAQSLADIQAQVRSLIEQLAAIQIQLASTGGAGGSGGVSSQPDDYGTGANAGLSCPKLSITMQRGSRDLTTGGQVSELQVFLADYYNLNEEDIVSGYFGKFTEANVIKFQQEKGLPAFGIAGSLTRAKIAEVCGGATPSPNTITVTAPNGGEQWKIGELNTITWTPYQYNPDVNPSKDVSVYLERTDGTTVGRIMDQGKASLHTYFNIDGYDKWAEPGRYYVRAVNNVTGASDRSDAPFTLLPHETDVKVNGTDGPVSLSTDQEVYVSWRSSSTNSCWIGGLRDVPGSTQLNLMNLPSFGSRNAYYTGTDNIVFNCQRSTGGETNDIVAVNVPSTSSLMIISPNGGEAIALGKDYDITYDLSGIKSISIALYKNDTWQGWIVKDSFIGTSDSKRMGYTWHTPGEMPMGVNAYKIYVTGQKADGTGYVDDKSDAPFSFAPATPATPVATYRAYLNGSATPNITTESISEADALANCKLNAANNPNSSIRCTWGDKLIHSNLATFVSVDKTVYAPGEKITVAWRYDAPTRSKDWIALAYANQPWRDSFRESVAEGVGWFWTKDRLGEKTLVAPSAPGDYQVVYYVTDTGNPENEVARSATFSVAANTSAAANADLANVLSAYEAVLTKLIELLR